MASTKAILTSLHGKRVGLSRDGHLVVNGRTCLTQDDSGRQRRVQGDPSTLNTTGTLTAAVLAAGIVTSTAASAVVATLDTGTAMDTYFAAEMGINEAFEWAAINTHATNAFTVTASSGHTLVGSGIIDGDLAGSDSSSTFRTRRVAANSWVTYRIG